MQLLMDAKNASNINAHTSLLHYYQLQTTRNGCGLQLRTHDEVVAAKS